MTFGNFTIRQENNETHVDYRRSVKDWVELFISFALGIATCIFLYLMYVYTHFVQVIFWIVGFCFAFFALVKLADAFARLFQPTKSIIIISKNTKLLIARYPAFKRTKVEFGNITAILLKGKNITSLVSNRTKRSIYLIVDIATKNGTFTILNINSTQLLRFSDKDIETEEYKVGQGLTKFLASEIGVRYQWIGFERT